MGRKEFRKQRSYFPSSVITTKKWNFIFLPINFTHSIFQAVTVRPLSSAWTEWSILNSRKATTDVEKNRRWQMYILRNGCEPGKSKRMWSYWDLAKFLTLHSFSRKRQYCILSFYWADTGFKVYRLNRFGLNSYILFTSCHKYASDFKWILIVGC